MPPLIRRSTGTIRNPLRDKEVEHKFYDIPDIVHAVDRVNRDPVAISVWIIIYCPTAFFKINIRDPVAISVRIKLHGVISLETEEINTDSISVSIRIELYATVCAAPASGRNVFEIIVRDAVQSWLSVHFRVSTSLSHRPDMNPVAVAVGIEFAHASFDFHGSIRYPVAISVVIDCQVSHPSHLVVKSYRCPAESFFGFSALTSTIASLEGKSRRQSFFS